MKEQLITHKNKLLSTKVLVGSGLLVGLSVILTRFFGIMLPIAGVSGLRISFGSIPIYTAGILFGPLAGALTGVAADLLGFMINPMGGAYFPGFTLSAALRGVIPGIVYMGIRSNEIRFNFNIINTATVIVLAVAVVKALFVKQLLVLKNGWIYYQDKKLSVIFIVLYIVIVFVYILIPILMGKLKMKSQKIYSLDKIFFIVTLSTLIVSIVLNSLWLAILFNKGYIIFLPTRIISSFITIPVDTFILYSFIRFSNGLKY
ncbi:folate family ECF transporter S component [Paramaledivibacter caminithermalis]|jgi:ECF transporter S component (folate family)|uniref:ECF transporter S component, folate family n=1 Tax=Paramaledivibacter caminithermalis (strain DSM 15212 / CIP 107654 / DViRD3) TaxID=1121301 RepID=A0A1M6LFH1_PARC5|nr:folate family ECF transporter S component [Paramaledivibacter caminithermalis]SHJ69888.1 ECF transporter S component, folate family [Paramaledivibacter caminithermalis DSM 15212]